VKGKSGNAEHGKREKEVRGGSEKGNLSEQVAPKSLTPLFCLPHFRSKKNKRKYCKSKRRNWGKKKGGDFLGGNLTPMRVIRRKKKLRERAQDYLGEKKDTQGKKRIGRYHPQNFPRFTPRKHRKECSP